ncbi:Z1 domain-containing protein [Corynebacterium sp. H128]|uniref:Z1 domain-containing protein n=1 Tax=Corynebacterium sp. H128 TaxID=3133427 RepID=UPI0030A265D0
MLELNAHYQAYLERFSDLKYRQAVEKTAEDFSQNVLDGFDFFSSKQCLMYGDVQSGKTSHVMGVIGKAIEAGFEVIMFLTSDNTRLVDQSFDRIDDTFPYVSVLRSDDDRRFNNNLKRKSDRKPMIIVLNKNKSVLTSWKRRFQATGILHGMPLFIVDDEADAASLNNKVNSGEVTAINELLTEIRRLSTACVYLQVTGTPQAIILQSQLHGWRPDYVFSFDPGPSYIGGNLLFGTDYEKYVKVYPPSEESEQREFSSQIFCHLVTSGISRLDGLECCNMLIHQSRFKTQHSEAAKMANKLIDSYKQECFTESFLNSVKECLDTRYPLYDHSKHSSSDVVRAVQDNFNDGMVKVLTVNSESEISDDDNTIERGINIIIGGDSLGRGLTIPALQTVLYSRPTKSPNADTLWQHARMFGYDRRAELLNISLPGPIFKAFREVNEGNEAIKRQISKNSNIDEIGVILDKSINPTRTSVVFNSATRKIVGGVNYFASDPRIKDFRHLDALLRKFKNDQESFMVSLKALSTILDYFETDSEDFPIQGYQSILNDLHNKDPRNLGELLIRTGRQVSQGKGTLLSPNDRKIADEVKQHVILILYRIEGPLGWSSDPVWVPNIKFPENKVHYRSVL